MQTSMQELIERLEILSKKHHNAGLLTAIEIANSLLEMEKQMIIKANRDGVDMAVDKKPFIMGEQYYKEIFVSKGSDEAELPKHPSVISENGNELLFDKEGNLIKEVVEDDVDVEKFALKYIDDEWSDADDTVRFGIEVGVKIGYNKAKETLYTEEQMKLAFKYGKSLETFDCFEDFINSLKQPKK